MRAPRIYVAPLGLLPSSGKHSGPRRPTWTEAGFDLSVGADFVEFNPVADRTSVTGAVSAKLVKELAARILLENR
jgi:hypothetical protein